MVIKKTIVMSVLALVIALTTVCYRNGLFEKHARSTVSLIEALTISPARQQDALDALAKYDNTQLAALFPYLEDHRALASGDVKFLNIHPSAFEETYMTEAHRVMK